MNNKYRRLKATLLAGTITLSSLGLSGCTGSTRYISEAEDNVVSNIEETTGKFEGEISYFEVGEHIISVPIKTDIRDENFQFEYYEGYEPVGISIATFDGVSERYKADFGGGVILYKNIVPVKCTLGENGYTTFGTPIENEQVKTLK